METKNALLLLAKVSGNKNAVLEIAKSYAADSLRFYNSVKIMALKMDNEVVPIMKVPEFAELNMNVAKINKATTVIDEFFMLDEGVAKLKEYFMKGMLVPYDGPAVPEPEPEPEVKPEPKVKPVPEPKAEPVPELEAEPEKKPEVTASAMYKAMPEVKEPEPVEEEPVAEAETKSEFVGIRKIETEDSVKAMVGYAEGDNYENPYETVYEDDVIPEEQIPTAIRLFTSEPRTDKDGVLAEAKMVMDEGRNYIYTGSNPSAYLNKRFEYYRIKYALKNIEDGADPEPEVEIVRGELDKIRDFEKRSLLISIQMVEYDMALVEKVYGLLKEFDSKLYSQEALPDISRLRELMDSLSDYDEKASLLTKFYRFDVPKFLKVVYTSCSQLELDKNKRLSVEKDRLEKESFDQIMALEKEYYAQKQGLKGKLLGGGAKSNYNTKKKELEDKMNRELEALEKEITMIVESDTKMVGKNMKLYARIDNILKNNVLCFNAK